MSTLKLYELINPSDAYTFRAPNIEIAGVCACLLSTGFGARCLEPNENESTPVLFGWNDWALEHGINQDFIESHLLEIADCYDSFLIGDAGDRLEFEELLAELTPEQAEKLRSKRQNRKRSSINQIGEVAYSRAKAYRKAHAKREVPA